VKTRPETIDDRPPDQDAARRLRHDLGRRGPHEAPRHDAPRAGMPAPTVSRIKPPNTVVWMAARNRGSIAPSRLASTWSGSSTSPVLRVGDGSGGVDGDVGEDLLSGSDRPRSAAVRFLRTQPEARARVHHVVVERSELLQPRGRRGYRAASGLQTEGGGAEEHHHGAGSGHRGSARGRRPGSVRDATRRTRLELAGSAVDPLRGAARY
jgi:hypothetical protein